MEEPGDKKYFFRIGFCPHWLEVSKVSKKHLPLFLEEQIHLSRERGKVHMCVYGISVRVACPLSCREIAAEALASGQLCHLEGAFGKVPDSNLSLPITEERGSGSVTLC